MRDNDDITLNGITDRKDFHPGDKFKANSGKYLVVKDIHGNTLTIKKWTWWRSICYKLKYKISEYIKNF